MYYVIYERSHRSAACPGINLSIVVRMTAPRLRATRLGCGIGPLRQPQAEDCAQSTYFLWCAGRQNSICALDFKVRLTSNEKGKWKEMEKKKVRTAAAAGKRRDETRAGTQQCWLFDLQLSENPVYVHTQLQRALERSGVRLNSGSTSYHDGRFCCRYIRKYVCQEEVHSIVVWYLALGYVL